MEHDRLIASAHRWLVLAVATLALGTGVLIWTKAGLANSDRESTHHDLQFGPGIVVSRASSGRALHPLQSASSPAYKNAMATRTLQAVIPSIPASDGAGVKLRRSLGQAQHVRVDPFLMLDEFFSDDPQDYLAGFPDHPHRGFETVTYILDGHMLHQDHLGNRGDLRSGGVQWMTAGRGIIHSEMPQQSEGRMRGFQLWVNLPAKEKMKPAGYKDLQPEDIPEAKLEGGGKVRVIGGSFLSTKSSVGGGSTDVTYLDVHLPAGKTFRHAVRDGYSVFLYPYEGELSIEGKPLRRQAAGVLSRDGDVELTAGAGEARFLLLAGRPIGEPIVQYGPFVMTSVEEIEQAIRDYQSGALVQ